MIPLIPAVHEWEDPQIILTAIQKFVYNGGGFIGVGEPTGSSVSGQILSSLADVLGVEKETGFTLNYDKYNWEEHPEHFILEDCTDRVDFGEGKKSMLCPARIPTILVQREKEVQMAVHEFGKGRAVYISGLPYIFRKCIEFSIEAVLCSPAMRKKNLRKLVL